MNHEEVSELLGVYALDAVETEEAIAIEDHLRDCARCRAEVADHRETAALLAHASTDAPPALWDRIASSIEAPAEVVPMAPRLSARRLHARRVPVSALLGAAAALVIAVLGIQVRNQSERIDDMSAALATAPVADVRELSTGDGQHLPVVLRTDGQGQLQADRLPALPAGKTYQLWGVAGETVVSLGVLGPDPDVVTFVVEGYSALAITEEQAPGVVQSKNQPVASGALA